MMIGDVRRETLPEFLILWHTPRSMSVPRRILQGPKGQAFRSVQEPARAREHAWFAQRWQAPKPQFLERLLQL